MTRKNYEPVLRSLLSKCNRQGFQPTLVDDGGEMIKVENRNEAINAVEAVDTALVFLEGDKGKFSLVLMFDGVASEVVADYSAKPEVLPIVDGIVNEFYDQWEGKPVPLEEI